MTEYILHGDTGEDTQEVMEILRRRGFAYQLVLDDNPVPRLLGASGVFAGLGYIRQAIGFPADPQIEGRFRTLRNLQDGWNNGEGVRLSERGLSWLYCSFSYGFPT